MRDNYVALNISLKGMHARFDWGDRVLVYTLLTTYTYINLCTPPLWSNHQPHTNQNNKLNHSFRTRNSCPPSILFMSNIFIIVSLYAEYVTTCIMYIRTERTWDLLISSERRKYSKHSSRKCFYFWPFFHSWSITNQCNFIF